jgi:hypothetical protein
MKVHFLGGRIPIPWHLVPGATYRGFARCLSHREFVPAVDDVNPVYPGLVIPARPINRWS